MKGKKQHIGRFGTGCSGLNLGLACLSAPGPGQPVCLVSVIRQEAQDYQNRRPELVQSLVGKFDEQGRPGEPQDLDHALKRQQFGALHIDFHERRAPGSLVREQPVERHGGDRHAGAVPGKLVVGRVKRVDFEKGRAGLSGGDHPQRLNAAKETRALERAGFLGRVEALRVVAAAEPGTTFLEINPLYPSDHKLSRNGTGVPVTAVTLDGLLADKGPRRPALVKIDVQGAELLALQGMIEILRFARPALFVELSDQGLNKFGASVLVVLRLLSDNGYEAYWLTRTGRRKASQSEIEARTTGTKSADVLFLPLHRTSE